MRGYGCELKKRSELLSTLPNKFARRRADQNGGNKSP